MSSGQRGIVNILQDFSIPLLVGVAVALIAANLAPTWYEHALHWEPLGAVQVFGHALAFHFLVNDVFMVFFFGIAAKEITEACLPGGSLNPVRKAINPLLATLGGVFGPVAVFFVTLHLFFSAGAFGEHTDLGLLHKGWGIPTATDIALAWLVARAVFGAGHRSLR